MNCEILIDFLIPSNQQKLQNSPSDRRVGLGLVVEHLRKEYRAFCRVYGPLLRDCKDLLSGCRTLLSGCRALLRESRAFRVEAWRFHVDAGRF